MELPQGSKLNSRSKNPNPPSDLTSSNLEGIDLGLMVRNWTKLAVCESRISLFERLLKLGIGFREVEAYSEALNLKFLSLNDF